MPRARWSRLEGTFHRSGSTPGKVIKRRLERTYNRFLVGAIGSRYVTGATPHTTGIHFFNKFTYFYIQQRYF